MAKVANTRHANVEPCAVGLRIIDFVPCGRRQTLHSIVATAQDDGAESVDAQMNTNIKLLGGPTGALVQQAAIESNVALSFVNITRRMDGFLPYECTV